MAQRALRGYLLGGWRGGSAVGVRTLSGHLAPAGRSSPLSFRGQRHRSQTPPPRGPRRLAWPGRHPLQPGGPGRSQLLSQPLFKPRRRFPLGESPRGWDGRGPNLKSLTPAVRPLVPGREGAAGTELPPLGPAQAGSSPRALLAPLLHLNSSRFAEGHGPSPRQQCTVYGGFRQGCGRLRVFWEDGCSGPACPHQRQRASPVGGRGGVGGCRQLRRGLHRAPHLGLPRQAG